MAASCHRSADDCPVHANSEECDSCCHYARRQLYFGGGSQLCEFSNTGEITVHLLLQVNYLQRPNFPYRYRDCRSDSPVFLPVSTNWGCAACYQQNRSFRRCLAASITGLTGNWPGFFSRTRK